jgi:hypothetical protein
MVELHVVHHLLASGFTAPVSRASQASVDFEGLVERTA